MTEPSLIEREAAHQDRNIKADPETHRHSPFSEFAKTSRSCLKYAELFQSFGDRRMRVLDIGTGTGGNAARVAMEGHDVVTVDISTESLRFTEECSKRLGFGDRITTVHSDADEFLRNAKPGDFDVISGANVLHHLPEPEKTILRIRELEPRAIGFLEPIGTNPAYQMCRWIFARFGTTHTVDEEPFKSRTLNLLRREFPGVEITYTGALTPAVFLRRTPLAKFDDAVSNAPFFWRLAKKSSICWKA